MKMVERIKYLIDSILKHEFDINNINELINIYEKGDEGQRVRIRDEVYSSKSNLKIISLSVYLSKLAYDKMQGRYIQNALVLHSIEDFRWDPRENIISLSIIWHVIQYLKLDAEAFFEKTMLISSNKTALYLKEFFSRPSRSKALRAMGLRAICEDSKITFEPIPPPWQKG